MRNTIKISFTICLICFFCLLSSVTTAEVGIVVNNSNSITSLSKADLIKIFKGSKTEWNNGGNIDPVILKSDDEEFYSLINMSKAKFNKFWIKLSLSGKAAPLTQLNSDAEMVEYIKTHKNSIGFVTNKENAGDVKVVAISD